MANDTPRSATVREPSGREEQPSAAIFDGRTFGNPLGATPESGARAGYDGTQRVPERKKGSKVHMAVDTLGNLLALHVTAANEQGPRGNPTQVYELAEQVQEVTGDPVQVAFVDQGYTGDIPQQMAADGVAARWPFRRGIMALTTLSSNSPRLRRASSCCPSAGL